MAGFRRSYTIAGVVLMVELALQFYLIAAAAWSVWGATPSSGDATSSQIFAGFKIGDNFASLHAINGTLVIPLTMLVMIGLAFGARHSGRVKLVTAGLFGLMVIQAVLGFFGGLQSTLGSAIAGLHGLNAMAIVGVTAYLLSATWAFRPEALAQPSARSGLGASGL
jgi:hypothetical protein